MLYQFLRPIVRIVAKFFFKKIYIHNMHLIPQDKPVIIASNHPSAFLEPVLMAVILPKPVFSMVKGSVFTKPLYIKLLKALKMIPIFRIQEGYANLKNNQATFDVTHDLLKQNQQILIFVEGTTIHHKHLKPLQKGAARIAFSAIEKYGTDFDMQIVPCGVNYTNQKAYRDTVMMEYGAPIRVLDFWQTYCDNNNRGIVALTNEMENRIKPLVVHIEHTEDEEVTEQLLIMQRNTVPQTVFPIQDSSNIILRYERRTAKAICDMDNDTKNNLKIQSHTYLKALKEANIKDFGVAQPKFGNGVNSFIVWLGFVPFLIGYVMSYLYIKSGKLVADKYSPEIEYYASIWLGVTSFAAIVYFLIWIIIGCVFNSITLWGFIVLMPILGFYSLQYYEFREKWRIAKTANKNTSPVQLADLQDQRLALLNAVEI